MIKKACLVFPASLLLLLSGCWNSIELDEVAMVLGGGLDQTEQGIQLSVEILQSSSGGPGADEAQNQGIVVSAEGETFFDAARTLTRKTKRRLMYTHTNIWVISEALARDNLVEAIDLLKRDQMPRLNSILLITKEDPQDILDTSTISQDLTSVEMMESMEATRFTSQFEPMEIRRCVEMLSGPVPATFIPIVRTSVENEETITELEKMAVIKGERMIGELDVLETKGLLYLRGEADGGSVTTKLKSGKKISIEAQGQNVRIKPELHGDQLMVDVHLHVQGTLAEVPSDMEVNDHGLQEIEEQLVEKCRLKAEKALHKLQKELQTDLVEFGAHVYRKYPQQWQEVKKNWDEIFAQAEVHLHVSSSIEHKGLIKQNVGGIYDKPQWIPFKFLEDDE